MAQGIALFDFDHTLINQGSLAKVLSETVGKTALIGAALTAGFRAARHRPPHRREIFRAEVLRRTLKDRREDALRAAAERVSPEIRWNGAMLERYVWHRAQGHRILVATGGLASYMPILLERKGLTPDGLLASEMVVENGVFSGEMAGPACTWDDKARRIKAWLTERFGDAPKEIWGYGNLPNDGAMLALADHKMVI